MTIRLGLFDIMQVDPTDQAGTADVYRRRLDDLALADDLGLAYAFTAERHFMRAYRCPAPGAWLGAASQRTRRIRLGVMAYTLPLHPPAALAEEIAVLDQLSGGRLEVGLGLGHRPEELVALGIDPADRIAIFQERLALLNALWTGGQATLETEHNVVRDVLIHPLPLQTPHPPLWYAGTDPGAAAWAAAERMGLALGFRPPADLQPAASAFLASRRARAAKDAESGTAEPLGKLALMRHVYLAETDEGARAEMTDDLLRLRELRENQGPAGEGSRADRRAAAAADAERLVREEIILAGSAETVAAGLTALERDLGIEVFLANVYAGGVDDDRIHRALRMLATEVNEAIGDRR